MILNANDLIVKISYGASWYGSCNTVIVWCKKITKKTINISFLIDKV